jgi:hypothetical protein
VIWITVRLQKAALRQAGWGDAAFAGKMANTIDWSREL